MFTKELFSLLIYPKASEKKGMWKRPPPIRLSHIFTNIIGIYLQTMRIQIRLPLREQPNTGPRRSTEMAMTTQQTQKSDDLNVSDAQRVSYGIKLRYIYEHRKHVLLQFIPLRIYKFCLFQFSRSTKVHSQRRV